MFPGVNLQPVDEARAGDIIMVAGLPGIGIGDTIMDPANPDVSLICFLVSESDGAASESTLLFGRGMLHVTSPRDKLSAAVTSHR